MFDTEIQSASATWGVPVSWIQAFIKTESNWNPNAYRAEPQISDGSYGLMQLLSSTAKALGYTGTTAGLYDPETNIDLGTKLMSQLIVRYGNDFRRVYSAYNSGNPDLWQTSEQVASNVARALAALLSYGETAIGENPGTSAILMTILFLLAWMFRKKK